MNDEVLIKTYTIGLFILVFLEEWSNIERIGPVAKIYNTITKKHNVFYNQIIAKKRGKNKKISKKCHLFVIADIIAEEVWNRAKEQTTDISFSVNITMFNLYERNAKNIQRVYGLDRELFKKINISDSGVALSSCRVGRILDELLEERIYGKSEK